MINESFCGDGLNGGGIGRRYPLVTTPSWDSNSVLGTSLIISTQNNFTVAIVGTADGRLLKVITVSIITSLCAIINYCRVMHIHEAEGWRFGFSGNVLVSINEVTLHQARLVLGWVTGAGKIYISI